MNPTAAVIENGMSRNQSPTIPVQSQATAPVSRSLRRVQPFAALRFAREDRRSLGFAICACIPQSRRCNRAGLYQRFPEPSPSAQHSLQHSVPVNEPVLQRAANVNGDQRSEKV